MRQNQAPYFTGRQPAYAPDFRAFVQHAGRQAESLEMAADQRPRHRPLATYSGEMHRVAFAAPRRRHARRHARR